MLTKTNQDEHAETIMTRIESRLASGLSRSRLANEAGIKEDNMTTLLHRSWKNTNRHENHMDFVEKTTLASLEAWLEEDDKTAPNTKTHAETPSYRRILGLLAHAHTTRELFAITGDVGIGKSNAASAYAAEHPKTDKAAGAIYVEFSEVDAKPTAALNRIFDALPGKNLLLTSHRQDRLLDAVAALLKPGDLLILDECNYLSGREGRDGRALDVLRDLHGKCRVGIVLLGNPDLRARVWGKSQEFAALASRTLHFPMGHTTEEDVDTWLQWAGVTGKAIRAAAIKIAARPGQNGGLRTLARVVSTAQSFYGGDALTAETIEQTARMLGRL